MTSLKLPIVAALMALSAGIGATGAVYVRPLQPAQQPPVAMAEPAPVPHPAEVARAFHTVSWFKGNAAERIQKVALCRDNPGVGQHDPECTNALEAQSHADFDAFINSK